MNSRTSSKRCFYKCLEGQNTSRVPMLAYHFLLPRGELERKFREAGCALLMGIPIYKLTFPSEIELCEKTFWESGERILIRTYSTPVGCIEEKIKISPYGSEWKQEHFLKSPKDYDTLIYLLEKARFQEQIEDFIQAENELGEDGIAVPMLPFFERSPFQKILIDLAGPERTLLDLYDRPQQIENLLNCLYSRLEEGMKIYRLLPNKKLFWWVDNVTADFTTPSLFKEFCIPAYQRYFPFLQAEGISCMVHLDGKLKALKELIQKSPIDVIESLTLPEQGGDVTLKEARTVWQNKIIAFNIPANLVYRDDEAIEDFFEQLLEECRSGGFVLELSEDLPRSQLRRIISILLKKMSVAEG